jgi:RNA polymerase sigma-70 factor, ECF subfamily
MSSETPPTLTSDLALEAADADKFVELSPAPDADSSDPLEKEENTLPDIQIDSLVSPAVTGDRQAIEQLLRLLNPIVMRYCRSKLGRHPSVWDNVEDTAQEVMVAVLGALRSYEPQGRSFLAFVYGIAAHKVQDAFRAGRRNYSRAEADMPDTPSNDAGPEQRAINSDLLRTIGALMTEHLTPYQREVLILRIPLGFSAEETAEALDSTPGAIRLTQHRALNKIRRHLANDTASSAEE